jgi:hypothetical protein
MGWNDRLGLLSDEEYEDYVGAAYDEGDRLRKIAKEEQWQVDHPRKPNHKGCVLPGCVVDSRGYSDCLERACPHCGAQDLYEARCLVCGRSMT